MCGIYQRLLMKVEPWVTSGGNSCSNEAQVALICTRAACRILFRRMRMKHGAPIRGKLGTSSGDCVPPTSQRSRTPVAPTSSSTTHYQSIKSWWVSDTRFRFQTKEQIPFPIGNPNTIANIYAEMPSQASDPNEINPIHRAAFRIIKSAHPFHTQSVQVIRL